MKNIERYKVVGCPPVAERRDEDTFNTKIFNSCLKSNGDCFVCWLNFVTWLLQEAEDETGN